MTYAADHTDFASFATPERNAHRAGILWRIFDAIFESRQRHAELEIARFIARSGGRLTDDVERRLMERISQAAFGASSHTGGFKR